MMKLERNGDVFLHTLDNGDNRIHLEFAKRMNAALDEVEAGSEGNVALVIAGTGKFFSNGLNLEWLMPAERAQKVEFGASFKRALGRLATPSSRRNATPPTRPSPPAWQTKRPARTQWSNAQ